jgi:hypothetical protein
MSILNIHNHRTREPYVISRRPGETVGQTAERVAFLFGFSDGDVASLQDVDTGEVYNRNEKLPDDVTDVVLFLTATNV